MTSPWKRTVAKMATSSIRVHSIAAYTNHEPSKTALIDFLGEKHRKHLARKTFLSLGSSIELLRLVEQGLYEDIGELEAEVFASSSLSATELRENQDHLWKAEDALNICKIAIEASRGMRFLVEGQVPFLRYIDDHPGPVESRFDDIFQCLSETLQDAVGVRNHRPRGEFLASH